VNVVKLLLEYSADINLKDHEERSPLHWAALGGHAEVCDLLIKKGNGCSDIFSLVFCSYCDH